MQCQNSQNIVARKFGAIRYMPLNIALLYRLLELTLQHGQHEANRLAFIVTSARQQTDIES